MNIKSTAFLILVLSSVLSVTHGYLGCSDPLISCSNKTHCVNIEEICIDHHDCDDGTGANITCKYCEKDETDSIACVTQIAPHIVFECLSPKQICDGKSDCINKEDEVLCGIRKCKHNFWPCMNGTCIEKTRICDGHKDCLDGSDEGGLICHDMLHIPNKIHCPTGEYIPESKMCDGIKHCSDGFDEKNCLHLTSTIPHKVVVKDSCSILSNKYTCSTSGTAIHPMCISNERVCDGYKDCPVGDDEHDCTTKCTSKSVCIENLDVTCLQHPQVGQLCRCIKSGYRLINDSQVCQDFDECSDSLGTYCSFKCLNTDGNFNCTCPSDFTVDEETKTCRKINDLSKPNLLVLFEDNISLYTIWNSTSQYSSRLLNKIYIEKNHQFNRIQYDPYQMFLIYYDRSQRAILCNSNTGLNVIQLISNVTINGFAYNAKEQTLFIIENQSQTLRMYTPINCDRTYHIKMHSWSLENISNSINSMEIDVYNRQIIFASDNQFMVSNISEPNSTKVVYTTERPIRSFIYDAAFKRIFWTAAYITNDELFPVYTCDGEFKQCHDTSIRLPSAWPFAFFDDSLLFSPLSSESLDTVQLYGKYRFSNKFVTSTSEKIRSFLLINHRTAESSNLCINYSTTRCKEKLCLQINSTEVVCLSIDGIVTSKELTTNITKSALENAVDLRDSNLDAQLINRRKKYRYTPKSTILICIIIFGLLAAILAFFVKRCHKHLNQKTLENEQTQNEQFITSDEPNLDEFSVTTDERVSKQRADYAREILSENPALLLIGRRRDSV